MVGPTRTKSRGGTQDGKGPLRVGRKQGDYTRTNSKIGGCSDVSRLAMESLKVRARSGGNARLPSNEVATASRYGDPEVQHGNVKRA